MIKLSENMLVAAIAAWLPTAKLLAFVPPSYHSHDKAADSVGTQLHEHVLRTTVSLGGMDDKSVAAVGATKILRDQLSGQVRILSGRLTGYAVAPGSDKDAYASEALRFIDEHQHIFGVSSEATKLVDEAVFLGENEQFLKLQVHRDGLLIKDAGIDFRFKHGQLVQVVNESFAEATKGASDEEILEGLEEKVRELTKAVSISAQAPLYRVSPDTTNKGYRLIKVIPYQLLTSSGVSLSAEMDTASGKLIELKDKHYHYGGQAQADAHPRWYNQALSSQPLSFVKVSTANSNSHYTDKQGAIDDSGNTAPRLNGLHGKFVTINPLTGGTISQTATLESSNWNLELKKPGSDSPWLDKYLAQVMVYVHTNAVIARAKKYINPRWLQSSLQANVNLSRTCNAHWDGQTINLYSGSNQCANTGLIADVIYHEWGHGLDHNTGGIVDGAFSEGYGDIISLIMTRSHLLGIGFRLPNHEPVRDLEPDRIYPRDRGNGEVHSEGLIIGSTFWDLFQTLSAKYGANRANDIIANFAFKMIYTAARYTQVYDALLVIDDNDDNLSNGTPNLCLINKVFHKHGLARKEDSCQLAAVDTINFRDSDGDGIIEPAESIDLQLFARNFGEEPLVGLEGHMSLLEGNGVQVEKASLGWEPIPAGESLASRDSLRITVAEDVPCGSMIKAQFKLAANEREVTFLREFNVGKMVGLPVTYEGSSLPAPIRDLETTLSPIEVVGQDWLEETTVSKAHLAFTIEHPYQGDLEVKLKAPDGSSHVVYAGEGSEDNIDFSQDISHLIKGIKGLGKWALAVYDKARRDEGSLKSFILTLTPHKFLCD